MPLKIEKRTEGLDTILRLSGRIESEHLKDLGVQTKGNEQRIVLDLEEVRLVDREAVRFLRDCQANGMELRHCPTYIREWIVRENNSHENEEP